MGLWQDLNNKIGQAGDAWRNSPSWLQGIVGLIPFGDGLDLAIEAHRQANGRGADPVIVTLSAFGLAADAATLTGIGAGFNATLSMVKAAYNSMGAVGKEAMQRVFAKAAQDPKAMQNLLDTMVGLAKDGTLVQLTKDFRSLPKVLETGIIRGGKFAVHQAKSIYLRSKDSEKSEDFKHISSSSIIHKNSEQQSLLDAINESRADFENNGVDLNDPSQLKAVMEAIQKSMEKAASNNQQLVPGG